MDIQATLKEISALSIDQRIEIVQAIWDEIGANCHPTEADSRITLSEAQRREIDRRLEEYERNPEDILTWAEIKALIQRR
jgi:putative addiction module component (TIGR02574 family)